MKPTAIFVGIVLTMANMAQSAQAVRSVDAIASGAKLTKADAARQSGPQGGLHRPIDPARGDPSALAPAKPGASGEAQRGIEKKDIRRGMVIVKPGSIAPHGS